MASRGAALAGATAAAGALLWVAWQLRQSLRRVAALEETLLACEEKQRLQGEQICRHSEQIKTVWSSQSVVFTVCQYNILASYLGDNKQPWFLYGIPGLTEERRAQIMEKFYQRGPDGAQYAVGGEVSGVAWEIEPETKAVSARSDVADELVVGVGDPES